MFAARRTSSKTEWYNLQTNTFKVSLSSCSHIPPPFMCSQSGESLSIHACERLSPVLMMLSPVPHDPVYLSYDPSRTELCCCFVWSSQDLQTYSVLWNDRMCLSFIYLKGHILTNSYLKKIFGVSFMEPKCVKICGRWPSDWKKIQAAGNKRERTQNTELDKNTFQLYWMSFHAV